MAYILYHCNLRFLTSQKSQIPVHLKIMKSKASYAKQNPLEMTKFQRYKIELIIWNCFVYLMSTYVQHNCQF